jgi:hypothetical protein
MKKIIKKKSIKSIKKKSVKSSMCFSDLLIIKESIKKIGGYDRFVKALRIYNQLSGKK